MDKFVEKIWFIFLDQKQEGPYSLLDLKRDERLTPETFAWKEGMKDWKRIAEIPELHSLFQPDAGKEENMPDEEAERPPVPDDEIVLDFQKGPPQFYLWLLLALFLIFIFLYVYIQWS